MDPSLEARIARLPTCTVATLREEYLSLFGEPTASRHKTWLVRRIAWRMQADAEGGLSERALCRAAELANDAEIRVTPPRLSRTTSTGQTKIVPLTVTPVTTLMPGMSLRREWKGQPRVVTVLSHGFDYNGTVYGSLSAVARAITGTRWNGHVFFGLKKQREPAA